MSKISGYANSVAALGTDDLLDVSEKISSSPDVYESRKMTGAVLATFIQSYLTNLYTSDGTLSGARTVSHGGNLLTFDGRTHIGSIGSDNSAILSAGSTNRGFLMPRLTTAQKNAVSTPATGLLLYDTNLNGFEYYNGSAWTSVANDSIYSASGTVPTSVVATLTDTLTFSGGSGTEFNIYSTLSADDIFTVLTNGGGSWKAKNGSIDIGAGSTYSNYYTRFSGTGIKSYGAGSVVHEINNVTGKVYFMNGYMSGQDFIIGSNATIGSEEISLQGRTLVQGADTLSTSTAFEIYDGDTSPSQLWDFRNNGDVYQGKDSTWTIASGKVLTIDAKLSAAYGAFQILSKKLSTFLDPYFKIAEHGGIDLIGTSATQGSVNIKEFTTGNTFFKIGIRENSSDNQWSAVGIKIGKLSANDYLYFNEGKLQFYANSTNLHEIDHTSVNANTHFFKGGAGKFLVDTTNQIIFGGSAIIGSETISLQGDTLIDGTLDMNNNRITKTIVNPTVQETTSTATLTINANQENTGVLTAQAVALTVANPTGTAVQGQKLVYRIKDNGTGRAITWGANFRAIGVTLPTTTTASKLLYVGCIYNTTDSKWDVVAVNEEA